MIIGVPKEIKDNEYRVALTPGGVSLLVADGHRVLVEAGAGAGSGLSDDEYRKAGAELLSTHAEVYRRADLIYKVKEPLPSEYDLLGEGQILFAYLHLAANPELARALIRKGVTGLAFETVELPNGSLPLLAPMSEIAGRMSVQAAMHYLERQQGGSGKLLAGVPGVPPAHVVVIGAGNVGANAARIALGLGARVTLMDRNVDRLRYLGEVLHGNLVTLFSTPHDVAEAVALADVVVGAVLVAGARAPIVVTRPMIASMHPGSVVVDVAVDQGGCIETSHPTTHSQPTYVVDSIIHYCVANIPGAVPRTSTFALSNVTEPYVQRLARLGLREALAQDPTMAKGLNVMAGRVTHPAVAAALGMEYQPVRPS
ncbi:MAG: alanine dehydrogenase [Chloroflexota bacterium]|nr:MAG: alanine dehydrogenase [Chloroflexota bacterium]